MEEKMGEPGRKTVRRKGKNEHWQKTLISLIAVLLVLTAAVYGYGVYYFSGHFLPGTQVNGFNCSYMNQKETEKLLDPGKQQHMFLLYVQEETVRRVCRQRKSLLHISRTEA